MARVIVDSNPQLDIKFLIAGDGPIKGEVRKKIKSLNLDKKIQMIGHIDEPQNFLGLIDIFVLTSDSGEGVPQSIMQAMLMNVPVVATNAGSTFDLNSENSISIVNKDSLEEIITGVQNTITNLYNKKKNCNSRKFIMENFSKEIMVEKILKIYKNLLEQ